MKKISQNLIKENELKDTIKENEHLDVNLEKIKFYNKDKDTELNLYFLIKSCINLINCVTFEKSLLESEVLYTVNLLNKENFFNNSKEVWSLIVWDCVNGPMRYDNNDFTYKRLDTEKENPKGWEDFNLFFESYVTDSLFDNSIVLFLDSELSIFYSDNPVTITNIKNFYNNKLLKENRVIIFQQNQIKLPTLLSKIVYQKDISGLSFNDCLIYLSSVLINRGYSVEFSDETKLLESSIVKELITTVKGFSEYDLNSIFNKIITGNELKALEQKKDFRDWGFDSDNLKEVVYEKEQIIKKSGYLEYFHPEEGLSSIGGLDRLKNWIDIRGSVFKNMEKAKQFGLPTPKGLLLLGVPGTGKSLTAKAIGFSWGLPVIKMDMGKIFGSLVGESENNMRTSLRLVDSISPCVLWIDEIEKGMSGIQSSGSTDGGTTSRVLGTFLTWAQEKTSTVFIVATANDISKLPPEFLRKGRVDEIFFVDLPSNKEREEILKIQLNKVKRDFTNFDIDKLVNASEGFSGAEIEEGIKDSLFSAFYDNEKDITTDYILNSFKKTYPISKTMEDKIKCMREWAKQKAIFAN